MEVLQSSNQKIHMISLGCARNRVDSEVMLGTMMGEGWEVTSDPSQADSIVVNTCGFIQAAKEESIDTILEAARLKESNPDMKLVVAGCLTQRYKTQLAKGLPEVDLFVGTDEFPRIAELLAKKGPKGEVHARRGNFLYDESMSRKNTLGKWSAYLKIAEGCQHNCAFCIIPAIRGRLRSREIDSVVREATSLASQGVVEVNLIAQDLAAYGRDRRKDELCDLLEVLVDVDGLNWIRLLYMYPENISERFLQLLKAESKIVNYLDIPVQHASNRLLERMNRGVTQEQLREKFLSLRQQVPEMAIRTSVMVGFPGETEKDFAELLDFIKEMRFDHLGCFTYSQEEGTVAGRMPDQVSEELKIERQKIVMEAQKEISKQNLSRLKDSVRDVLILGPSQDTELVWEGRLATQAPEVDGVVYITDGPAHAGSIQPVLINEAHDYDLVGEVIADEDTLRH